MIKNSAKKLFLLNLFLFSLFMNNAYPYSLLHDRLDSEYKCRVIFISGIVGLYSLLYGTMFSVFGHNRQLDTPTTPSERHFYVMRNFLPKEDLEKIKAHDQVVAMREIKAGKILLAFGALSITAGIFVAYLNEIFTAITKQRNI